MTFAQRAAMTTRLKRLPVKVREQIDKAYERHKRACERLGVPVDPLWMADAIIEAENVRDVVV